MSSRVGASPNPFISKEKQVVSNTPLKSIFNLLLPFITGLIIIFIIGVIINE